MTTTRTPERTGPVRSTAGVPLAARLTGIVAALLSLAVAYIHVTDQGGFPGSKEPRYVGVGYYILEAVAVVVAVLLVVAARRTLGWILAVGVAAAPIIGYVLSRGPGLPAYTDDKGNWSEPLGVWSLIVEGVLLVIALGVLAHARREH